MKFSTTATAAPQRILVFAAQIPTVANKRIYFLFSQRQMEDILMDVSVRAVPLAPAYAEGVAEWREHMVPVISLESFMGMKTLSSAKTRRAMVVRLPKDEVGDGQVRHIMLWVVPPIRMLTLPIECSPATSHWLPRKHLVRAVYEWSDGYLVVADLARIPRGKG